MNENKTVQHSDTSHTDVHADQIPPRPAGVKILPSYELPTGVHIDVPHGDLCKERAGI